ncbi:MFS transporter [Streptomyces sp. NPDC057375]|uniref:MFS transporter n=1 Tax=Streptomyces sp. NPDC057375 TaxID=3346109 RepID=UPI003628CFF5
MVFTRSASVGPAALAYALTLLPELIGGPLLSWLADRYPRRELMMGCDLARMGLVGAMAIPGPPLWLLCVLLVLMQLLESPYLAARSALLATTMPGERYLAAAVVNVTSQVGQLAGLALGGMAVALLASSLALLIDAGILGFGVIHVVGRRTAPASSARTVWRRRTPIRWATARPVPDCFSRPVPWA